MWLKCRIEGCDSEISVTSCHPEAMYLCAKHDNKAYAALMLEREEEVSEPSISLMNEDVNVEDLLTTTRSSTIAASGIEHWTANDDYFGARLVTYSVRSHSCALEPELIPETAIQPGRYYVRVQQPVNVKSDNVVETNWYQVVPKACRCSKYLTLKESSDLVQNGDAETCYFLDDGKLDTDDNQIWRNQQKMVPRIDMITAADMQRAYLGEAAAYVEYIDASNEISTTYRLLLFRDFIPDPFEGRSLFPFGKDQRTVGGYKP